MSSQFGEVACAVLALSLSACAASTDTTEVVPPDDTPIVIPPPQVVGEQGEESIAFAGFIVDELKVPVADASVCVFQQRDYECAGTDADGAFSLEVPHEDQVILSVRPFVTPIGPLTPVQWPHLWPVHSEHDGQTLVMHSTEWVNAQVREGKLPISGGIAVLQTVGETEGFTMRLRPFSGGELHYVGDDGNIDQQLEATSTAGTAFVFGAMTGTYDAVFAHTDPLMDCTPTGWLGSGANTASLRVVERYITVAVQACDNDDRPPVLPQ